MTTHELIHRIASVLAAVITIVIILRGTPGLLVTIRRTTKNDTCPDCADVLPIGRYNRVRTAGCHSFTYGLADGGPVTIQFNSSHPATNYDANEPVTHALLDALDAYARSNGRTEGHGHLTFTYIETADGFNVTPHLDDAALTEHPDHPSTLALTKAVHAYAHTNLVNNCPHP